MTVETANGYRIGVALQRLTTRVEILESSTDDLIAEAIAPVSKTLAYDGSDRLSVVTDARGTKTMTYDGSDKLTAIAGTGEYASMTFTYSGDQLTAVTVT